MLLMVTKVYLHLISHLKVHLLTTKRNLRMYHPINSSTSISTNHC